MGIWGRIVVIVCAVAFVIVCAVAFVGCIAPQNAIMVGVDLKSWSKAESIIYENSDTTSLRNLNIALRYNDNFRQTTLPLKVTITTPDARYFEEEVTLQLERPNMAIAVTATESIPYRTDVLLNQSGYYTISFEPLSEVRGVEAIGIEFN